MTRWIEVFRYELQQQLRRKSYLFVTFGLPLLALLAFGGYLIYDRTVNDGDSPVPDDTISEELNENEQTLGYVDLTPDGLFPPPDSYPRVECQPSDDETDQAARLGVNPARSALVQRVTSPSCLQGAVIAYNSRDAGEQALDDESIDVLYVIEPDYVETGSVTAYIGDFSIEDTETQTLMQDFLIRSLLAQVEIDPTAYEPLYLRLRNPAFVQEHRLTDAGTLENQNENRNYMLVYGFGILNMFALFWGGGYLMQSVVQEKESRIIEILLSSVRPIELLLGKILAMGLLSMLQVGMFLGVFLIVLSQAGSLTGDLGNIEIGIGALVLVVLYFVLGFLLYGSLMACIGALSTTVRESQNFVAFVTLPAVIPFFFLTLFAEEPNGSAAVVMSLVPITAPLSMVMRLAVVSVPVWQILLSVALLVLAVAGAIWLAGRLFRVNVLLMGNMPRLRDLPRLLRG